MEEIGIKSVASYGLNIRYAVRGLWSGNLDIMGFVDSMSTTIIRGYESAWQEGASSCGITPAERSVQEQMRLDQSIAVDMGYIMPLADYIVANSKANGGKLRTCLNRAKIWTNRYNAVKTIAQSLACADRKFIWNLGPTKIHCSDCAGYAGRVHRMSVWRSVGALTQSPSLNCGGWNCLCSQDPTDARATPGRPRRPSG